MHAILRFPPWVAQEPIDPEKGEQTAHIGENVITPSMKSSALSTAK